MLFKALNISVFSEPEPHNCLFEWPLDSKTTRHVFFMSLFLLQEYNIHGWWVGEMGGNIGIVPKEYLHPAYIV